MHKDGEEMKKISHECIKQNSWVSTDKREKIINFYLLVD